MGYQENADSPVRSTTSTKTNGKPRGNKQLNANITVHIHFATAAAFAPIPTPRSHTLPPSGHCRYQSVWSTTAQFAWLASSAPASQTGTQEQSSWELPQGDPPGPVHRPPLYEGACFEGTYLALFYLRRGFCPPAQSSRQPS